MQLSFALLCSLFGGPLPVTHVFDLCCKALHLCLCGPCLVEEL